MNTLSKLMKQLSEKSRKEMKISKFINLRIFKRKIFLSPKREWKQNLE